MLNVYASREANSIISGPVLSNSNLFMILSLITLLLIPAEHLNSKDVYLMLKSR